MMALSREGDGMMALLREADVMVTRARNVVCGTRSD